MPKIIIFPLGLAVDNQQQISVDAFARFGISKFAMLLHWIPLPRFLEQFRGKSLPVLFDEYRRGDLNTHAFREAIRAKFPNADFSDANFDLAWNRMCVVTDKTREALHELKDLVEQEGHIVYLLANTNPLHVNYIQAQYGSNLPGIPFFSFHQKKLGNDLLNQLYAQIKEQHPGFSPDDIGLFYTPPKPFPYADLGRLAWLRAPFQKWFHSAAVQYVTRLLREAVGKCTLLEFTPNEQGTGIYDKLTERGWLGDTRDLVLQNTNSFTPGRTPVEAVFSSSSSSAPANEVHEPRQKAKAKKHN